MKEEQQNLEDRVLNWINKEGYPLEFETAKTFASYGFATSQGRYINDPKTRKPKEVDVVAQATHNIEKSFLRVCHVVECKWTNDKPWVIFTDSSAQISEGACIAQSISTRMMSSILWYLAGESDIQSLNMFKIPSRPGFNGRQAFSSQSDLVYSSLQSVVSACSGMMNDYEKYHTKPNDSIAHGVFFRPLIVIKGRLFETYFNHLSRNMEIKEQNQIRLHWKGAETWKLHSTIDIVTIDHLNSYVQKLGEETKYLIERAVDIFAIIKDCLENETLTPLNGVKPTSRGIVGLPPLLGHLVEQHISSSSEREES